MSSFDRYDLQDKYEITKIIGVVFPCMQIGLTLVRERIFVCVAGGFYVQVPR